MYVRLKIGSSFQIGDVVSFDSSSQSWVSAQDLSKLVGVINSQPTQYEGDDFHTAELVFSGIVQAKASRDVAVEGGLMAVESGGVYVSATDPHCGAIAPQIYSDSSVRPAGSLVMVHLR